MNMLKNLARLAIKHKFLLVGIIAFSWLVFWLGTHGTITITLEGSDWDQSSEIELTLIDESGSASSFKTKARSISRVVRTSQYEVLARGEGHSAWTTVDVGRFLGKRKATLQLINEVNREFVGNTPSSCAMMQEDVLLSYDCGSGFETVKIHMPATALLPTYTIPVVDAPLGIIEGHISTTNGPRILARTGDDTQFHVLYEVDTATGKLIEDRILNDLPKGLLFSVQRYNEGYLLYDDSYKNLYYYTESKGIQKINQPITPKPNENRFKLTTSGNRIVRLYSDQADAVDADAPVDEEAIESANNTIYISSDLETIEFSPTRAVVTATLCSDNRLCVVEAIDHHENRLFVYDTALLEEPLYSLGGVDDVRVDPDGNTLLVKDGDVWRFDASSSTAYRVYSLGGYSLCGLGGYYETSMLCIEAGEQSFMLLLESGSGRTIDKQAYELREKPDIERVSVYRDYIYVTPALDWTRTGTGVSYDPDKQLTADKMVQQYVSEVGINTDEYKIINTRAPLTISP